MKPGTRVRFIADPGRTGVATERSRERAGRLYIQVVFPDRTEFVPCSHIEVVPAIEDDSVDLFGQGRFGRAKDLRGNMTYIRLNGQLANLIYSMETTNTDFYPYQFKPVLKFLDSPNNGLLIADEVGLGKTIEAGLIWTELRARFDFQRLMVLCPSMLRDKWNLELRRKIGVDAENCDAARAADLFHGVSTGDIREFAIIASLQGLRPPKGWEAQTEVRHGSARLAAILAEHAHKDPLVDLLV